MDVTTIIAIGICLLAMATLYSSVGHGGGSGYLAVMALFSLAPALMRPSALVLNIAVASVGLISFASRGKFSWRTLLPFAATGVPMAFIGGQLSAPPLLYQPILAVCLLWSAIYLMSPRATPNDDPTLRPPIGPALVAGALMGLVSGITGIGGGVFLSPLLLLLRWAPTQQASGVTAAFILLNSSAGLAGQLSTLADIDWRALSVWIPLVLIGGYVGSRYGSRTQATKTIYRLLGAVLLIAAAKMILTLL